MVAMIVVPSTAEGYYGARQIPVGLAGVNEAQGRTHPSEPVGGRMYAIRFVLDSNTTMYRFFSGFNLEGVYTDSSGAAAPVKIRTKCRNKQVKGDPDGEGPENCESGDPRYPPPPSSLPEGWKVGEGRLGYAHGDGGTIEARLVSINANGTPNLSNELASNTFNPVDRYEAVISEYGMSTRSGMLYSEFGGVSLQADTPYAVVYRNVDSAPEENYVSYNSPVSNASVAGPNGQNNLDPNAQGAVAGLDPREAVAWTTDGGLTWGWGHAIGGSSFWPDYVGSGDEDVKLPWYAWTAASGAGATRFSNQPYYSYPGENVGNFRLVVHSVPRAVTLTKAGGYAPIGSSVGVVTVKNLRTGQMASTPSLGSGLQTGMLSETIPLVVGDDYEITHSGTVFKAEGDAFLQKLQIVKDGQPYTTEKCQPDAVPTCVGAEPQFADRAELFSLPHPFFPAPHPPVVTTSSATGLTPGSAALHGTVNPQGPTAQYRFEYGTSTSYGMSAPLPEGSLGAGSAPVEVSTTISGLQPATTYHYRLVGTNSGGSTSGEDATFTTSTLGWMVQANSNPAGADRSLLLGVACPAATSCYASGESHQSAPPNPWNQLVETWSGSWSQQGASSPTGATATGLAAVSCSATSACMAAGQYKKENGFEYAMTQRWNGTSWSVQTPPVPTVPKETTSSAVLPGVSCASSTMCMAAGHFFVFGFPDTSRRYIYTERWDGTAWTLQRPPEPIGTSRYIRLLGISCPSTTSCMAVGHYWYNTTFTQLPLAERWDGTSWTAQTPPSSGASITLAGVSCSSTSACTAVGSSAEGSTTSLLIERWNGTTWSKQSAVAPIGATSSSLAGISCQSETSCVAVGQYKNASSETLPLVETWSGSAWTASTAAVPAGAISTYLTTVSCPTTLECIAVGTSGEKLLIERSS